MRNNDGINIEDPIARTQKEANHPVPQAHVFEPNYHGVHQVLIESGGQGAINFWNALAHQSQQKLQQFNEIQTRLRLSNAMSEFDTQMYAGSIELLQKYPTGEGYLEAVTTLHDKLSAEYLKKEPNTEANAMLQQHFMLSKKNYANSAFAKQNELMTAYALNQVNNGIEQTMSDVINNPDNMSAYLEKLSNTIETTRNLLPAAAFENLAKTSKERFFYSYGLGLIEKDPNIAANTFASPEFKKEVSHDTMQKLLRYAALTQKAQEQSQPRIQKLRDNGEYANVQEQIRDLKTRIKMGEDCTLEVNSLHDDKTINDRQYHELQYEIYKAGKSERRRQEIKEKLQEYLKNGQPALDIAAKDKNMFFYELINDINEQRQASGKEPLTYTQIADFAISHGNVFNVSNPFLTQMIEDAIRFGTDPYKILDACTAINGRESIIFKGLSKETRFAAKYIYTNYQANKNINQIAELRERAFAPIDEATKKYRQENWKVGKFGNPVTREKELDALLKDSGFEEDKISDLQRVAFREDLYQNIKYLFERTGSMGTAESLAINMLKDNYKLTDINGPKEEYMFNPPTIENTNLPDDAIKAYVDLYTQDLIKRIVAAKTFTGTAFKELEIKDIKENPKEWHSQYIFNDDYIFDDIEYDPFIVYGNRVRPRYVMLEDDIKGRRKGFWSKIKEAYVGPQDLIKLIKLEAIPGTRCSYNLYIQIDDKNPLTKEYLLDPDTWQRAVINFEEYAIED